ncbi:MAG: hypothetical protein KDI36_05375 [Pseudomonadales bacterium]|nr:hypothetical protein [Pseudomonadales bacterium]
MNTLKQMSLTLVMAVTLLAPVTLAGDSVPETPQKETRICKWFQLGSRKLMTCGKQSEISALRTSLARGSAESQGREDPQHQEAPSPGRVADTALADPMTPLVQTARYMLNRPVAGEVTIPATAAPVVQQAAEAGAEPAVKALSTFVSEATTPVVQTDPVDVTSQWVAAAKAHIQESQRAAVAQEETVGEADRVGPNANANARAIASASANAQADAEPVKPLQPAPVLAVKPEADRPRLGYIVLATEVPTAVIPALQQARERDYLLLHKRPYADRVSLGVFSSLDAARQRQAIIEARGIGAEVVSRDDQLVASVSQLHSQTHTLVKQNSESPVTGPAASMQAAPSAPTQSGFMVAVIGDADEVLQVLRAKGDSHHFVVRHPGEAPQISVGVYRDQRWALNRQRVMASYGLSTDLIDKQSRMVVSRKLVTPGENRLAEVMTRR